MQQPQTLDFVSLEWLFVLTVVAILISIEAGYRLGRYRRQRSDQEKEGPVGTAVAAILALLGFLLAFVFGIAASRFETRRMVLLEESNAIGTAYLRAGLLPNTHTAEVRTLLREYVDVRLDAAKQGNIEHALQRSEDLHGQLWTHAETVGREVPSSPLVALFVQSLNETIDVHAKRVMLSVRNRIPSIIWLALYLVTILCMVAVGYQAGLTRTSRSPSALFLALSFAAVILLIADLDRPGEGLLRVSQAPMLDLRRSMGP